MSRTRPLAGIRVVEFGHIAAGPFAGLLLADLGADVVKVEPPQGDGMRQWPPFEYGEDEGPYSLNFASINRNKRSIRANLRDPGDREMVLALTDAADVLIENFRPGVMERLGFGFEQLTAGRPSPLIYCSITGYGSENQRSLRGAYDVVVQAESGVMSVTGEPDGSPVKCGVPIGDFVTGLYAALAITAAVAERERLPRPRSLHLDCSMTQCLLGISALQTSEFWGTGAAPRRLGSAHPRNAPYRAFEAKDASFVVAAGNEKLWRRFCDVVEMPELVDEAAFITQEARALNQEALFELLAPRFLSKTATEWLDAFEAAAIPCGRINSFADALSETGLVSADFIRQIPLPTGQITKTTAFPVNVDGWDMSTGEPPSLGADRTEVLSEWLGRAATLPTHSTSEEPG